MSFPSGPGVGGGGPMFRFTRPPGSGDVVMGPQGPMMSGPRGFLNMGGEGGGPRGPVPFGGGMLQQGGMGGEFGPGVDVPTSQEFPMPPNFPGAVEMMAQVSECSWIALGYGLLY